MAKYEVFGHANVVCSMIVEANSHEEAIKIANDEFGSLVNYAGITQNLISIRKGR